MTFPTTSPQVSEIENNRAWHNLTGEQTLEILRTNGETGLIEAEIVKRKDIFGLNELKETGGRSPLMILSEQFTNIMLVMLIAVAVVSAVLDLKKGEFPKDAIAIFTIVILNGILGYLQESRAEKALAALKQLSSPKVRVIRNGSTFEVTAKELVPGDIMLLEAGVQLAADGRLLEAQNLQIREAALTGEAESVNKQAQKVLPEDASLGDRINLVYQGTEVVQGRGKVAITKTGMDTEIGKIAALLQGVESEPTPLQQRMSQLGNVLVSSSLALVAVVVLGGVIRFGWQFFESFLETSLSMAVAVVPEGLPAVVTVTLAIGTQRMVRRQALIRKLPAVETLGSVTTICSDKTGTLTQNKMVVQKVNTSGQTITVTGEGYAPIGEFSGVSESDPELQAILTACVLCNDALLQNQAQEWSILGDPTEGALLTLAGKGGLYREALAPQSPRLGEFPFSSERKRMSVICENAQLGLGDSAYLMFTKGSPELILERCSLIQVGAESQPLTPAQK